LACPKLGEDDVPIQGAVSVPAALGGEVGAPVAVASLPARGRPPQAAARRAGLEFVEKLLTTKLTSTDTTERNAGMLRVPHRRIAGRAG
jgi:hypothetical protein